MSQENQPDGDREAARATEDLRAAAATYRKVSPRLVLEDGTDSVDLLERSDRF